MERRGWAGLGGGWRVCTPSRACAVPASVPASEGKEEEKGKREKEKEKRKREKEKEKLWAVVQGKTV